MYRSKRHIALLSIMAMLLYFVPNLVQNIHRVSDHHEYHHNASSQAGMQLNQYSETCAVCVFEFNVVDKISNEIHVPLLKTETFLFEVQAEDQIQNITFHYYNLRAPPQA